jgi:hypothetical protein|tara:strand:+ start:232 stop:804 length:573 start_codon:yes stop_codon:yes gene_type:complete
MGNLKFSIEPYDSLLGMNRPNGTSRTWNLKEEGKISMLNTLPFDFFRNGLREVGIITDEQTQEYVEIQNLGETKHLYVIRALTQDYFYKNVNTGFKVISEKIVEDIKINKCKIVLDATLFKTYTKNTALQFELIERWRLEAGIPVNSVAVLLRKDIDTIYIEDKDFNFTCHLHTKYNECTPTLVKLYESF